MNYIEHCQICEHKIFNLKDGILCGLTNQKPTFEKQCPTISLGANLEKEIKEINLNYHLSKRNSTSIFLNFGINTVVGVVFVVVGYLIHQEVFNNGVIAALPFGIMGIGIFLIGKAFKNIQKLYSDKSSSKEKKEKFDNFLGTYSCSYDIDFDITEIHGSLDIKSNLTINKNSAFRSMLK